MRSPTARNPRAAVPSKFPHSQESATRGFGLLENFLAKKRAQKAEKLIPQHLRAERLLDLGCGQIPYFLLTTTFRRKYGIDNNLQVESRPDHTTTLLKTDLAKDHQLPFPNDYFAVLTMLAVIEHFGEQELLPILAQAYRVLQPGGGDLS